jgi:SAM-dependent methyltransferase
VIEKPTGDRQAHWQRVYEERAPSEVSWFQAEPALSLELIGNCSLRADDPIIDVGGGASVLVDRLAGKGFSRLAVLDICAKALDATRSRLGNRAAEVLWIESDVTRFTSPHKFLLWHDRALFHFLTDAGDRMRYVKSLGQSLAPGGHVIIASFAVGGPERCSGLPIVQYDAARIGAELGGNFRLIEERAEEHVTPAGKTQEFAYFRFRHADHPL